MANVLDAWLTLLLILGAIGLAYAILVPFAEWLDNYHDDGYDE